MKKVRNNKFLKKILLGAVASMFLLGYLGLCLSRQDTPQDEPQEVPQGAQIVTGRDGKQYYYFANEEDFLKHANETKGKPKASIKSSRLVAHADVSPLPSANDINTFTRFCDRFTENDLKTAVTGLINDFVVSLDGGSIVGDGVTIPKCYTLCGKQRLVYTYKNNTGSQILGTAYETITCFANLGYFTPSQTLNAEVQEQLADMMDIPFWMGGPVEPNMLCYNRELDDGSIYQFTVYPSDYNSRTNYVWYGGTLNDGFYFRPSKYNDMVCRTSESTTNFALGSGTGSNYSFVVNTVNNIDTAVTRYGTSNMNFLTSQTIASNHRVFYCSYVATNDNTNTVINETIISNHINNWNVSKFPIYRTEIFQAGDVINENNISNYNDFGITNINGTLDLDIPVFAAAVAAELAPQLQLGFDGVYSLQPAIGAEFSAENNDINYLDIVNPLLPDNPSGWQPPSYPAVTTFDLVINPVFPTTQTLPAYLPESATNIYNVADRMLSPEILPLLVALALFGICIGILM